MKKMQFILVFFFVLIVLMFTRQPFFFNVADRHVQYENRRVPQKSAILILASRKRIKRPRTTVFNGRHFHLMFSSWNTIKKKKKKNVLPSSFKYRIVLTIFFQFFH